MMRTTNRLPVALATAPFAIVYPFAVGGLTGGFSIHPPIAERVACRTALAGRSPRSVLAI